MLHAQTVQSRHADICSRTCRATYEAVATDCRPPERGRPRQPRVRLRRPRSSRSFSSAAPRSSSSSATLADAARPAGRGVRLLLRRGRPCRWAWPCCCGTSTASASASRSGASAIRRPSFTPRPTLGRRRAARPVLRHRRRGLRSATAAASAPTSSIENGARIGAGTILHPHVFVGAGCELGRDCEIHPHTSIGSDGFGYAVGASRRPQKIPHLGNVRIGDEVEIGSNCAIDRAKLSSTWIRSGDEARQHLSHRTQLRPGRGRLLHRRLHDGGLDHDRAPIHDRAATPWSRRT